MTKKMSVPRHCPTRQVSWPLMKPDLSNRAKVGKFIESTFCYRIVPGDSYTAKEMESWLQDNLGPRALYEAESLSYWTDGVWASGTYETAHFSYDTDPDDMDEDQVIYFFLSKRDATAFKMKFG